MICSAPRLSGCIGQKSWNFTKKKQKTRRFPLWNSDSCNGFRRILKIVKHCNFFSEGKQTPEKGQYLLPLTFQNWSEREDARDRQLHPAHSKLVLNGKSGPFRKGGPSKTNDIFVLYMYIRRNNMYGYCRSTKTSLEILPLPSTN